MTLKCFNVPALKSSLSSFEHTHESKPNGQSMYKFPNGFILNVYDTGSCVFQGSDVNGITASQVTAIITALNAPYAG